MKKIIIFASGNGSGFEALLKMKPLEFPEVLGLVCNKTDAFVLERAAKLQVPAIVVPHQGLSREQHEERILQEIQNQWNTDVVQDASIYLVLAGYMRLFSKSFIRKLWSLKLNAARMINIHPSLLPQFPGVAAYEQAWNARVPETGITVHYVDEGCDTGPIIAQEKLAILPSESLESLEKRGHELEHRFYTATISKIFQQSKGLDSSPSRGAAHVTI